MTIAKQSESSTKKLKFAVGSRRVSSPQIAVEEQQYL